MLISVQRMKMASAKDHDTTFESAGSGCGNLLKMNSRSRQRRLVTIAGGSTKIIAWIKTTMIVAGKS
jgi:hypothetical protein